MSFLLSLISLFQMITFRVEWMNDFINIPLKEQATSYQNLPSAKLFINDVYVIDKDMYYERDRVELTFFSTVNTSIVKAFYIKQRVHFPTHQVSFVQVITFNVIDDIPPTFITVPEFRIPIGEKLPNLLEGVVVSDNYDSFDTLSLSVSIAEVIRDRVGKYPLTYQLKDRSNNLAYYQTILEIYDHLPPTITQTKPARIAFNEKFVWQSFFNIKDNYDLILKINIYDHNVNYARLGIYPIYIEAIDQSNHQTYFETTLEIFDLVAPKITFRVPLPINVYTEITDHLIRSLIIAVSDNYDEIDIEDVHVFHDIDTQIIGDYYMYYQVSDSSNNRFEHQLKVSIRDLEKPTIKILEPLIFEVFDPEPILVDYFDFFDNYTEKSYLTYKITGTFNLKVIGKYLIKVEVTDSSKNTALLSTYIEVVDLTAPVIIQLNDVIITDFNRKNYQNYFSFMDQYDQTDQLTIFIDDSSVDYDQIGSYPLLVTAKDRSNNVASLMSEVIIIDIIAPIIEVKVQMVHLEIHSNTLDFKTYIDFVYDNYDMLSIDDVIIIEDINYQKVGHYDVLFIIRDHSLNETIFHMSVIIQDTKKPEMRMDDLYITMGEIFNPLEGVYTKESDSHVKISFFPETIDTSTPGKKVITYIAQDEYGNHLVLDRVIYVIEIKQEFKILDYIPVVLVTVIGGGLIFYFYKKQ